MKNADYILIGGASIKINLVAEGNVPAELGNVADPTDDYSVVNKRYLTAMIGPGGNDWALNGNTVGSVKTLGTIDNFALPFITNNTERARILNTGEFGIGTATPSAKLHVNTAAASTVPITKFQNTAGTIQEFVGAGSPEGVVTGSKGDMYTDISTGSKYNKTTNAANTGWSKLESVITEDEWQLNGNTVGSVKWIGTIDNFDFPLRANNAEVARVSATGFFGINQVTPTVKLHVTGTDLLVGTQAVKIESNTGVTSAGFWNNGSWRVTGNLDTSANFNVVGNYQLSAQSSAVAGIAIDGLDNSQMRFLRLGVPSAVFAMVGITDFRMYFSDLTIVNINTNVLQMYKNTLGEFLFSPAGNGVANAVIASVATTANGSTKAFNAYDSNLVNVFTITSDGSMGIRNATPSSVALLDIVSTTKGVVFPRMTTAQRNAITPIEGLIVYDTTIEQYFYYKLSTTSWLGM